MMTSFLERTEDTAGAQGTGGGPGPEPTAEMRLWDAVDLMEALLTQS